MITKSLVAFKVKSKMNLLSVTFILSFIFFNFTFASSNLRILRKRDVLPPKGIEVGPLDDDDGDIEGSGAETEYVEHVKPTKIDFLLEPDESRRITGIFQNEKPPEQAGFLQAPGAIPGLIIAAIIVIIIVGIFAALIILRRRKRQQREQYY